MSRPHDFVRKQKKNDEVLSVMTCYNLGSKKKSYFPRALTIFYPSTGIY